VNLKERAIMWKRKATASVKNNQRKENFQQGLVVHVVVGQAIPPPNAKEDKLTQYLYCLSITSSNTAGEIGKT
jgi:hypothetical protein